MSHDDTDRDYTKREIDHMFGDIKKDTTLIIAQTTRHNGRLTKVERILLIITCVTGTLLVVNGSKFLDFIKALFI